MHIGYAVSVLERHFGRAEVDMVADTAYTLCHRFDLKPSEAYEIVLEAKGFG